MTSQRHSRENGNPLPEGWCASRISEISMKGEQRKPSGEEAFIYVDIGSINRDLKCIESPQQLIGKDAPSRARKVVNAGDVLVSLTRPNLNAVAYVSAEYDNQIASTGFEVVKSLLVDSRYIFALTRSKDFIDSISGTVQGALYPAAKSSDVQAYEFPLPPLAEQKVIADKLDTLLAQVEITKARLDRIPQILSTFRQSVLAAAVSGKLTEEWRAEKGYSKWSFIKLEKLIIDSANGLSKRSGKDGEETTILRLADFKDASRVFGKERKIKLNAKEIEKYSLINGDILVIRVNGSVDLAGKFIRYGKSEEIEGFCDHFIRVRLDQDKILSKYLTYVANEGSGRLYLQNSLSTSAGQNTINQGSVKGLDVPLPSLKEQTEIVSRVEQLFAYADKIEQQVQAAQERVNNLTQSILAKAFRGELTADWRAANPDLITGDNSAESLLAKIKAQRESTAAGKTSKKAKA
jgi:type I restriction enzyme, S subunit